MRFVLFVLIATSAHLAFSQGLTLRSFSKTKEIGLQKYVGVHSHPDGQDELTTQEHTNLFGTLVRVTKDSLTLLVDTYSNEVRVKGGYNETRKRKYSTLEEISVLKANVIGLHAYTSSKSRKNNTTFRTIGGLFVITGLVTMANAALVESDARNTLLYSGGAQIGIGVILVALFKQKKLFFKKKNGTPEWTVD